MNGVPTQCQPLEDQLEKLIAEKRDWQIEMQTATGKYKEYVGQQINKLIARISRVQKQLDDCISAAAPRISNLAIARIEATQVIQFFRPSVNMVNPINCSSVRSGIQPENSIRLVGGKTTILRVYVDTTTDPTAPIISQLSGVLETRAVGSSTWHLPLTPYNAPITPRLGIAIDRRIANHTLNFRIPAARCQGSLELRMTVFDSAHPGETSFTSETETLTLGFINFARLQIRLVRIRYVNAARGINLPAPTVADFWNTAQFMLKTYPIAASGIDLVRESEALYDGDFTDISPGGNVQGSGNWGTTGSLYHILNNMAASEGLGTCVRYMALIPAPPANQSGFLGWAVGRTAIVTVFSGPTMAHELGHTLGRPHAPCGNPAAPDQCYPTYGTHPSASIGEIGFDYVTSQVYNPANSFDFMSYCGNKWVSPYTYEALMNSSCLAPTGAGGEIIDQPVEKLSRAQQLLYLGFRKYRDDVIVVTSPSFHLEGYEPTIPSQPTPYFVELHDQEGHILTAKRLGLADFHTSLDDAYLDFLVALPWRAEAAKIVFKREDQILHSVEIEGTTPEVQLNAPFGGRMMAGQEAISWNVRDRDEPMTYIIRYSNDGGQTWHAIATGISVNEWTLDFDNLPGGHQSVIQVLASAGFRTGKATSEPFAVAIKPRKPTIISPSNGAIVIESDSVHLFGFVQSPEGSVGTEELTWSSSINGFLGSGPEVVIHTLSVGRHRVTLSTGDGCGDEASTYINLTVQPREYQ